MNSVAYVGMDVDKRKVAMALLEQGAKRTEDQIVANEAQQIERYFAKLLSEYKEVQACYEAGSCGFELWRHVRKLGVLVTVASPGSLPRKSGDRVKTDRRDARKLAMALRNGDVSAVYVPSREDEEIRDYLRLYEDMKYDLKRAKQRLLHYLLRHGIRWSEGRNWTDAHWRYGYGGWSLTVLWRNRPTRNTSRRSWTCKRNAGASVLRLNRLPNRQPIGNGCGD